MKPEGEQYAEVGYSKETREIQLLVPPGTHVAEIAKAIDFLARDVFSKLPRGCPNCTSGDHVHIRERLSNVILVDLNKKVIVR
jgi:hypothetical protein